MRNFLLTIGCFVLASTVSIAEDAPATATVGKPAPDIQITGIDGETFKLSDVTATGKNVALMFSRAHW